MQSGDCGPRVLRLGSKHNGKITAIHNEKEAIDYALQNAVKDSFIVITSDVIPDALEQVRAYKNAEDESGGVL